MKTRIEPIISRHTGLDAVCVCAVLAGVLLLAITGAFAKLFHLHRLERCIARQLNDTDGQPETD